LHVNPQVPVASHVAVAFAGAGHGLQLEPHDAGDVLSAQPVAQAW
jgi:hypothetical protein